MRRIDIIEDYGRYSLYFDWLGLPCVLANLKVKIDRRRRGIGRGLLCSAVELASFIGAKNIYLRVKGGSWLKNFYKSEGFVHYAFDSYDKNQEWMMRPTSKDNEMTLKQIEDAAKKLDAHTQTAMKTTKRAARISQSERGF